VLVALDNTGAPLVLPLYLCAVTIAAAVGFVLVLVVGDRYLSLVGSIDNTRLSVGVLAVLCLLVFALTGAIGVAVFAASALVGLIPGRFGARRANLMGVLIVPLALGA
jgi:putative membrane protein